MRLEPKPAPSLAATLAYPLLAIVVTLVVASLLVLIAGASPFSVFWLVIEGAAGSEFAIAETLNAGVYSIRAKRYASVADWRRRTKRYRERLQKGRAEYGKLKLRRRLMFALFVVGCSGAGVLLAIILE